MSETPLTDAELAQLRALDTPTICNALEIVMPERRAHGFTTRPAECLRPELKPLVGYARTATSRSLRPSSRTAEEQRRVQFAYFDYLAAGPRPAINVIQDLDGAQSGYGAFWGEVQSNMHKALGSIGAVTDGSIRDLDLIAPGFQLIYGSVAPSHAFSHLEEFGCDVNVLGMTVRSGDLLHADRHGAIVIPAAAARKLVAACDLCARREAVILDVCKSADFSLEALKRAIGKSVEIH
ncbi:MAG: RraA family protein [Proteobacteria bacterium]|nr:RraA family protein [Pseudomonadota bacterium]